MEKLKTLDVLFKTSNKLEELAKANILTFDLTLNEFFVLETLYEHGRMPVQDLCTNILIPNSSMTYVLDRLEIKGKIKRIRCNEDRRTFHIELSSNGKELMEDLLPKHNLYMKKFLSILNDNELLTLQDLLERISENIKDRDCE